MKAAAFDYVRAGSVQEAVEALAGREGAKVLAGGQSLVPLLNMRVARPALVVDIDRLDDLSYLRRDNGQLVIGALARHRAVETSELVRQEVPLLAEALRYVGHVAVRNRGTIGGSLAHADPAAELPAVSVALDASFTVRGPGGERVVAAQDFFHGPHRTMLAADELLVAVQVPVLPAGTGFAVQELTRRSRDLALVAVFAAITLRPDGTCAQARIAVAGAGPVPLRVRAAEEMLVGQAVTDSAIADVAQAIAAATDPPEDMHAPAEYRRDMAAVLVRRAVQQAATRANGGS